MPDFAQILPPFYSKWQFKVWVCKWHWTQHTSIHTPPSNQDFTHFLRFSRIFPLPSAITNYTAKLLRKWHELSDWFVSVHSNNDDWQIMQVVSMNFISCCPLGLMAIWHLPSSSSQAGNGWAGGQRDTYLSYGSEHLSPLQPSGDVAARELSLHGASPCKDRPGAATHRELWIQSWKRRKGVSCAGCYCGHVNTPQGGELQRREMEENTGL